MHQTEPTSQLCEQQCIGLIRRLSCSLLTGPTDYVSPTLSPEDGKEQIYRNIGLFKMPDDEQSPKIHTNLEWYTPLSEPFRI
jgi:hypothetical protein